MPAAAVPLPEKASELRRCVALAEKELATYIAAMDEHPHHEVTMPKDELKSFLTSIISIMNVCCNELENKRPDNTEVMNTLRRVERKIDRVNDTTTETKAVLERIDASEGGVVLPLSP